jgi:hypothetical protein
VQKVFSQVNRKNYQNLHPAMNWHKKTRQTTGFENNTVVIMDLISQFNNQSAAKIALYDGCIAIQA